MSLSLSLGFSLAVCLFCVHRDDRVSTSGKIIAITFFQVNKNCAEIYSVPKNNNNNTELIIACGFHNKKNWLKSLIKIQAKISEERFARATIIHCDRLSSTAKKPERETDREKMWRN